MRKKANCLKRLIAGLQTPIQVGISKHLFVPLFTYKMNINIFPLKMETLLIIFSQPLAKTLGKKRGGGKYINRHCGSIFPFLKNHTFKRWKIIVILGSGPRRKGREAMRAHVHYFFQRQSDVPFMSENRIFVLYKSQTLNQKRVISDISNWCDGLFLQDWNNCMVWHWASIPL